MFDSQKTELVVIFLFLPVKLSELYMYNLKTELLVIFLFLPVKLSKFHIYNLDSTWPCQDIKSCLSYNIIILRSITWQLIVLYIKHQCINANH